jgi:hypothetical protein
VRDPYLASVLEAIARDALDPQDRRLISVDELRAAGALDVPASWRKSLAPERKEYPLFADEDMFADDRPPAPEATNDDADDEDADEDDADEDDADEDEPAEDLP